MLPPVSKRCPPWLAGQPTTRGSRARGYRRSGPRMTHEVRTSMSVPVKRKELHLLTCEEVGYLLCHLGLDKHVSHFERFGVDGIVLTALKTEKDLEGELGMTSHVQRINLISHVKEFVDKKGVPVDLLDPVRGAGTRTRVRAGTSGRAAAGRGGPLR